MLEHRHGRAKFERRLQLIPQRGRSILKGPLAASSAEEWYVQKLRVSGIPCRDGGFSDELRCEILWSMSHHALKNQNSKIPPGNVPPVFYLPLYASFCDKKRKISHNHWFLVQMKHKAMDKTLGQHILKEAKARYQISSKSELKQQKSYLKCTIGWICNKPSIRASF